ncbi:YjbQ family protein [Candidatus Woesearchaeota archaeon]|nr:YjbQ family protein [Candidatus Woesearchaeota archaeon]
MKEIRLSTTGTDEIIDITAKIEGVVASSGVKEGICLVYAPHATAAILIMEADGAVESDILNSLSNLVPKSADYRHRHGPDAGHGAAHVLSAILGPSKAIPVVGGKLQMGTWQSITFCELDGPRSDRRVVVQVFGA